MHVVMVSDFETQGGAAVAASRLASSLVEVGHEVTRLVSRPDGRDHPWKTQHLPTIRPIPVAAVRMALPPRLQQSWTSYWDSQAAVRTLDNALTNLKPDVINVHNLHGAALANWSPALTEVCARYAPTVWTLHDMWSFTGRCAYNYDCRNFILGCGASCPTPTEYPSLAPDRIESAWQRRRKILEARPDIVAVAPSRWLAKEASAGLWAGHDVRIIPYGLPLNIYRPIDKCLARAALDLPMDRTVIMVAAQDLAERRKGSSYLVEALSMVSHRPLTLLSLGHKPITIDAPNIDVHALGYVDHERTKALAYSAADLFVHPAPVDNLPNVVLETLACGTPVVGFPIGGVPDMVRPGQTGWLAADVSAPALACEIDRALGDLKRGTDLRASARAVAEAEYGDRLQAERYASLFASSIATSVHSVPDAPELSVETARDVDVAGKTTNPLVRCSGLTKLPSPPTEKTGWPWTKEAAPTVRTTPEVFPRPLVTVVTPSYNQGQYLEATIRSVLLQGYPNLEYIIIDGGSTDDSIEIIRKYEPWLSYWCSEPDRGQADAINKGFARATGEIYGWLNSDDIYEPGALRFVAQTLSQLPEVDLLYGNGWQINAEGERTARCDWVGPLDPTAQLNWNQILQPAAFWRSDVWKQAGPLDPSFNWGLDWEWFIRATAVGNAQFIPHDLAAWRITPDIKSVSADPARRAELASISRKHGGIFQPMYYMYKLDWLAEWMTDQFGQSFPGRFPQFPLTVIRLILRKHLARRRIWWSA